jgi:hypothetical protein
VKSRSWIDFGLDRVERHDGVILSKLIRGRPRALTGVMLAIGSLLLAGCGKPAGGDPGNRRLHELSSDRVFAALPDRATMIRVTRTPARYEQPGFTGGGWHGPSVVVAFRSSAPPAGVYRFYARRVAAAGWRPTASGALRLTDRWAKTYAHDGASAWLILALLTRSPAASERVYSLSGGIATVR